MWPRLKIPEGKLRRKQQERERGGGRGWGSSLTRDVSISETSTAAGRGRFISSFAPLGLRLAINQLAAARSSGRTQYATMSWLLLLLLGEREEKRKPILSRVFPMHKQTSIRCWRSLVGACFRNDGCVVAVQTLFSGLWVIAIPSLTLPVLLNFQWKNLYIIKNDYNNLFSLIFNTIPFYFLRTTVN